MLFIIGLGLADEKDISVKGLEAVKSCSRVYLEAYTSILMVDHQRLSKFYGVPVIVADREMVEMETDTILAGGIEANVAFLVVGDPYGATTHTDLTIRAQDLGIPVSIIHNASIMNAVGANGLSLYKYGQASKQSFLIPSTALTQITNIVSVVFFTETWKPDSCYDRLKENFGIRLHTLCLLDIKVKEQSVDNMARGRLIFEPPRFMTIKQAIEQLLELEAIRQEGVLSRFTIAVGMARVGTSTQQIVAGTLEELSVVDFGGPLHSLVITGRMHFLEADALNRFAVDPTSLKKHGEIV